MDSKCAKCDGYNKIFVVDRRSEHWESTREHYDQVGKYNPDECINFADLECGIWQSCPVCTKA